MDPTTSILALITKIMPILIILESGGDPSAVGKHGELGILQITKEVVDDCNLKIVCSPNYEYTDRLDAGTSQMLFRMYLLYWGRHYYDKHHKTLPSEETLCRIWNGGPRGYTNPNTRAYFTKYKTVERLVLGFDSTKADAALSRPIKPD